MEEQVLEPSKERSVENKNKVASLSDKYSYLPLSHLLGAECCVRVCVCVGVRVGVKTKWSQVVERNI